MRQEAVTISMPSRLDWKGIGYLFSIAGTLALGAVACVAPNAPVWYFPILAVGVFTTIIGFAIRYMAHLRERKEMARTRREAERPQ